MSHAKTLAATLVLLVVALTFIGPSPVAADEPPGHSACLDKGYIPMTREAILDEGFDVGLTHRDPDPGEVNLSLDRDLVWPPHDGPHFGMRLPQLVSDLDFDADLDCLTDIEESKAICKKLGKDYIVVDLTDPDICLAWATHSYPEDAEIPMERVRDVFRTLRELRFMDETIYLRAGSLNIFNGMVGLNFSCDGSHYMPWNEFLDKNLGFWLGSGDTGDLGSE